MPKSTDLLKKAGPMLRKLGPALAAAMALVKAAQENPHLREGLQEATDKARHAVASRTQIQRLHTKLDAVDQCADLVATNFAHSSATVEAWRRQVRTIRTRADLAWQGHTGTRRRKLMKPLLAEADDLLTEVSAQLEKLSEGAVLTDPSTPGAP